MANELTKRVMQTIVEKCGREGTYKPMPTPVQNCGSHGRPHLSESETSHLSAVLNKQESYGRRSNEVSRPTAVADAGSQKVSLPSGGGRVSLDDLIRQVKK